MPSPYLSEILPWHFDHGNHDRLEAISQEESRETFEFRLQADQLGLGRCNALFDYVGPRTLLILVNNLSHNPLHILQTSKVFNKSLLIILAFGNGDKVCSIISLCVVLLSFSFDITSVLFFFIISYKYHLWVIL